MIFCVLPTTFSRAFIKEEIRDDFSQFVIQKISYTEGFVQKERQSLCVSFIMEKLSTLTKREKGRQVLYYQIYHMMSTLQIYSAYKNLFLVCVCDDHRKFSQALYRLLKATIIFLSEPKILGADICK